ncbi:hypothetical protein SNEBB_001289 [Seison nebaliae]|nr:hypothetical protein SNEBB_001289 [Seison nebaliae]
MILIVEKEDSYHVVGNAYNGKELYELIVKNEYMKHRAREWRSRKPFQFRSFHEKQGLLYVVQNDYVFVHIPLNYSYCELNDRLGEERLNSFDDYSDLMNRYSYEKIQSMRNDSHHNLFIDKVKNDINTSIPRYVASDEATTCHIILFYSPIIHSISLAHLDGSYTMEDVIYESLMSFHQKFAIDLKNFIHSYQTDDNSNEEIIRRFLSSTKLKKEIQQFFPRDQRSHRMKRYIESRYKKLIEFNEETSKSNKRNHFDLSIRSVYRTWTMRERMRIIRKNIYEKLLRNLRILIENFLGKLNDRHHIWNEKRFMKKIQEILLRDNMKLNELECYLVFVLILFNLIEEITSGLTIHTYIAGGFYHDERSLKLSFSLLSALHLYDERFFLKLFVCSDLNSNRIEKNSDSVYFPCVSGLLFDVKEGNIMSTLIQISQPIINERIYRKYYQNPSISSWISHSALLKLPSINLNDISSLTDRYSDYEWVDDKQLLSAISTSPEQEAPHFVEALHHMRRWLKKSVQFYENNNFINLKQLKDSTTSITAPSVTFNSRVVVPDLYLTLIDGNWTRTSPPLFNQATQCNL